MKKTLFLSFLLLATTAIAQQDTESTWDLKRDRDGIQVFTRKVDGSPYDAVRAEMLVEEVRLSSMVALILDAEACPQWADRCAESYVHEHISDTEQLIYTLNDLPFPVKDRDVMSRVTWSQDSQTGTVSMHSQPAADVIEERKGALRLTDANVSWHFQPEGEGVVRVINEAHIDPGSALPGWVTNMLLVDTPFITMQSFREAVRNDKYAGAEIGFVKEPKE